jgi:hypothetical protein
MGYVYIARDQQHHRFKVGKTNNSITRMKTHKTSNPSLELVYSYETENPTPCEKFLKMHLAPYRICGTREFFFLKETVDLDEALQAVKRFEEECLPKRKTVEQIKSVTSDGKLIEPTKRDHELYQQLRTIRDEMEKLELQCDELENELKMTIGTTDGIAGLATWKSQPRKGFDFKVFEQENRDFVAEYEDIFRKYRTEIISRKFCLK